MLMEVLGCFKFMVEIGVWANAQGSCKHWFFLPLSSCQPVSTIFFSQPPSPSQCPRHSVFPLPERRKESQPEPNPAYTPPPGSKAGPLRDPRQALLMDHGAPSCLILSGTPRQRGEAAAAG